MTETNLAQPTNSISSAEFSDVAEAQTLVELLRFRAENQPNETLYTFLKEGETIEESWTYAELDRKARAIGAKLQQMGAAGQRVLLLYPPGLDYIAGFFGCLYAGAIAVPILPPRRNKVEERLLAVAKDSGAKIALTTPKLLLMIKLKYAFSSAFNEIKLVAGTQIGDKLAAEWTAPVADGDSLAFLQYTSGSTGTPKGVMVSYRNLLHNSSLIQQCFDSNKQSRGLIWLPFYHDMGLIGGVLQPLYAGFPVAYMSPIDFLQRPIRWLNAISDQKATISGGPNFAYELCVNKISAEQAAGLDLSTWDVAFTGAEPVRAATLDRFAQKFEPYGFDRRAFTPCYGLAESTVFAAGTKNSAPPHIQAVDSASLASDRILPAQTDLPSTDLVSSGRIFSDQLFHIVDPERCVELEDGQVGEIWGSGPSVAVGYWNNQEATAETFQAVLADTNEGPYLRTGDLGYSSNGELFVTGRLKDLIIIRGRNYYPQDIEQTVESAHPALRPGCTAAFAIEVDGEEKLVVIQEVTRHAVRNVNTDEVFDAIRTSVAQAHELQVYAVELLKPSRIPKTSSGKIQRHASKTGYLEGSLETIGQWTTDLVSHQTVYVETGKLATLDRRNSEHIQQWVVTTLAQKANVASEAIDLNKPFIDYGLDSVAAVELVQELNDWFDGIIEVDPTILWDFPTIEHLVNYLTEQIALETAEVVPNFEAVHKNSQRDEPMDSTDGGSLDDEMARLEALLK